MTADQPPTTLAAVLRDQTARSPARTAVTTGVLELTYGELLSSVDDMVGRLGRLGVEAGDRVALLGVNSIEWVLAFLGCIDLGAIVVPLNYRLSPAELGDQLALVQPRLVLCDDELAGAVSPGEGVEVRTLTAGSGDRHSIWSVNPARAESAAPSATAPALISFTSGSTGTPKGAVITHGALLLAARAYQRALHTDEEDRTLVLGPLFHNTGFCDQLAHMLIVGGTVDLMPTFGTQAAREALRRRPASYLIAVPGVLRLLALSDDAETIFGACRIACYGGSPMPPAWSAELNRRWPRLGLYNCYGLTEFTSVSHILKPVDLDAHDDSVGRPVPGVEQRIVGGHGDELPTGEAGMLHLAGPTRMAGYWRAPDRTREVLRGRWLITGDLASVDSGGFLHVLGRESEVINRGGEKVSPSQVEAALSMEELVTEAAVVGAPHPIFGQRVVAFVSTRGNVELDVEQTRHRMLAQVADYAVPEVFLIVDELPRNAAGKVDRRELRRSAQAAVAIDAETCA
jgi:long-chain acyl-CoA synthetase